MSEILIDKFGFSATVNELPEVGPFVLIRRKGSPSVLMFPVVKLEDLIALLNTLKEELKNE